jgi:hypothetical protein
MLANVTLDGIGITSVQADTTPTLGGNLILNTHNITGTGNINVTGTISNGTLTFNNSTITSGDSNLINFANNTSLVFKNSVKTAPFDIRSLTGSLANMSLFQFSGYATSLTSPGTPSLGDCIGGFSFNTYVPTAGQTLPTALVTCQTDGVINSTNANGKLVFLTVGGNGSQTFNYLTFDSYGRLAVGQQTAVATLDVAGTIRTSGYTVATLPAGTIGMMTYVTDALSPTYLGTLTGGGAVKCPVFYNGTAWVAH